MGTVEIGECNDIIFCPACGGVTRPVFFPPQQSCTYCAKKINFGPGLDGQIHDILYDVHTLEVLVSCSNPSCIKTLERDRAIMSGRA